VSKFKKDDLCVCRYTLKKKINGVWISKDDCLVRVIKLDMTHANAYRVYNIDFERYEKIGGMYLKINLQESRNKRLNELFN
jgi:hypothetical protein